MRSWRRCRMSLPAADPPRAAPARREQRREHLDGLQDDAVGEAGAGADAVGREHDQAGGLEDADVRGGRGQDRADVDRQQHRGGRHERGLRLQAEREHDRVAGQPLQRPGEQLAGDRGAAVARTREHRPAPGGPGAAARSTAPATRRTRSEPRTLAQAQQARARRPRAARPRPARATRRDHARGRAREQRHAR